MIKVMYGMRGGAGNLINTPIYKKSYTALILSYLKFVITTLKNLSTAYSIVRKNIDVVLLGYDTHHNVLIVDLTVLAHPVGQKA